MSLLKWNYMLQPFDLCIVRSHFSHVWLSVTPWTMASQAPLSMGFSRPAYWSGLPFPSPVIKNEVSEVKSLSHVRLSATPWITAYQAPLPMGFSRQEYCSGLPLPSPSLLTWAETKQVRQLIIYGAIISSMNMMITGIQFSSVTQSCPTLCDPMNRSTPGLPVHYQLLEFTQTHVHWVGDAIQPSHSLLSPSPPAPNPSQHQSLFQWVNSSIWASLGLKTRHCGFESQS